jgi:hypothetical protein
MDGGTACLEMVIEKRGHAPGGIGLTFTSLLAHYQVLSRHWQRARREVNSQLRNLQVAQMTARHVGHNSRKNCSDQLRYIRETCQKPC